MASLTPHQRRMPVGVSVALGLVTIVIGVMVAAWAVSFVISIVKLMLVLGALYLVARVGWVLIRKGR